MRKTPRDQVTGVVLAALEVGPAHGYRIAQRIREWSGGALKIGEGSLYPVLHALEAQGWVSARVELQGDRSRRVYTLTEDGAEALEAERRHWQEHVAAVSQVLLQERRPQNV